MCRLICTFVDGVQQSHVLLWQTSNRKSSLSEQGENEQQNRTNECKENCVDHRFRFLGVNFYIFSDPSVCTYVKGTQKNRLIETVLLRIHSICFG